ncbi:scamp family-domain-containing protein [Obelidium mucronatum]|nr:scamp family-domain-containing protein [Obelidium mucronatum]
MADTSPSSAAASAAVLKPSASTASASSWIPSFLSPKLTTRPSLPQEEDEVALTAPTDDSDAAKPATPTRAPTPTPTPAIAAATAAAATAAKEEALRKKEAELHLREQQLAHAEKNAQVSRVPNFPYCWPVMFHNIKVDIPPRNQWNMVWMYRSWMFVSLCLFFNTVAALTVMLSHPTGVTTAARDFGVSVTYWVGIMVSSFYLWYRPVYNAYMKESSMYFNFYFFFGGWHILFDFYMFLGIPGSGSSGVIYAMSLLTDDKSKLASGIMCSISAGLWLLSGLWSLFMYRATHKHYRSQGLTSEEAQNEAMKGVAKSGVFTTLVKSSLMA